jgi:4-amino-4-deoxy-L-arabinose transferase-like glycosyltransferase
MSRVLLLLGAAFSLLVLAPSFSGRYGLFIDELYYVACSERLALGYVDHPPLSIWLLRASRMLLGDGQVALRVLPALAGGLTVVTTGFLARRFGAGGFGQVLAGLAVATAPIPELVFGFYSMNAFELLLWTTAAYCAAEAVLEGRERWWLAFGAVAGLAMMNKHTFVLLGAGIVTGLALTPARRALASRWFWCGIAIAAVIFLPNVLWEIAKGWPTLEFYRNADLEKNVSTPPLAALVQQILFMNPAAVLLWPAGIVFLLSRAQGRPWRFLGCAFALLLALVVLGGKSRPDRIAGAYPIAFASGCVLWERASERTSWRWLRWALPVLLVVPAAALAPLSFPILSPESLARYAERTGLVPQVESGEGKKSRLPQWMADRLEWREFAEQIATIVERELTPAERAHAVILVPSYGHAGALEYYGRGRGLPPVVGTQNSCADWAPEGLQVDVVVAVEYGPRSLGDAFEEIRQVDVTHTTFGTPWRDGLPISIARRPTRSFWEAWRRLRHYV